ncbi:MAG: hypothetical protein FWD62_01455 [Betaproteobacteria bacterium]|nr:hypothetical protein [Betaproteobacteria bacterium]
MAATTPGIPLRLLLVVPAILALFCGVLAGLGRLGLPTPAFSLTLVTLHGPLMIGGLFGTLIGIERAVAVAKRSAYLVPLGSGLGVIAILFGQYAAAAALASFAALLLTFVTGRLWLQQRVAHLATLTVGAACWLIGSLAWLYSQVPTYSSLPWIAFLVLTIAGERLELSRLLVTPLIARRVFAMLAALVVCAAAVSLANAQTGSILFGLGLFGLAFWLQRYDIARRTLQRPGLTRYIALGLLSGYIWLGVAGSFGALGGFVPGSAWRDAALHALTLGFVFSMVFGHAPIILPAIARIRFPWHPIAYLPLVLLHLSVAARVIATLSENIPLRGIAALSNTAALGVFILFVAGSIVRGKVSR